MRCPRCDAKLNDEMNQCNHCGQDLAVIKHICRISNAHYNIGLDKARVRDLSGAVISLRKSLQFNKQNTKARNLLGLVYCEMGEIVAALSEWVLSKYLQPEENDADYYINMIQQNPVKLESVNQTIKKYNMALNAARTNNGDLAIIQLKKVVSINPKFVRAHQLLALLYIKGEEYEKAFHTLKEARKVDYNNTTTLKYLHEISPFVHKNHVPVETKVVQTTKKKDALANVTPVGSYKEEKRSYLPYINIGIGLIVGVLVSLILIRPTLVQKNTEDAATQISELKDQVAVKTSELSSANKEKEEIQKKADDLQAKIDGTDGQSQAAIAKYEALLTAVNLYIQKDDVGAALSITDYKKSDFDSADAKAVYTALARTLTDTDAANLVTKGRTKFNAAAYDEAITIFENALKINKDNQDALYYLGRCYQSTKKYKKAKSYYNKAIKISSSNGRGQETQVYLDQVNAILGEGSASASPSSSSYPTASPSDSSSATPKPSAAG